MEAIEVKKVTPGDLKQLQEISKQTFLETFSASNSEANMNKYLEEGFALEKLSKELSSDQSEFYFAFSGEELIGYLKLNFGSAQTELQENEGLEIERIYVLQAFHGKKIGQLLYEKALEIAKDHHASYVWLGVWEENPRAISFYQKNGFIPFDKHVFRLGDDEQTDILMKKSL